MAVYVDPIVPTLRHRKWPFDAGCHLTADSEQELHAFAATLKLKRAWCHRSARVIHYDLTAGKREQALRLGAVAITRQEAADRLKAAGAKARAEAAGLLGPEGEDRRP